MQLTAVAPLCDLSRTRAVCCHRLSSSDIKDKTELLKGRKDIEREMERFKVQKTVDVQAIAVPLKTLSEKDWLPVTANHLGSAV